MNKCRRVLLGHGAHARVELCLCSAETILVTVGATSVRMDARVFASLSETVFQANQSLASRLEVPQEKPNLYVVQEVPAS